MISLNKPIKPNLRRLNQYLSKINDCGWYTNFGPLNEKLTVRLEEYLGVKNLLLVNNGTTGLQIAGKVLNSHNIITTPFSFVATSSAFAFSGNKLAFSDIDSKSFNLCHERLEEALIGLDKSVNTIVATHVYGNPCKVDAINELGKKYSKTIIYDAAQASAFNMQVNLY